MKDEELFKAWKSEQYKDQSTEEKMEFVEHLHTFPKYFEKTFLAGLKAGRPQWHYVKDGLPKELHDVLCFTIHNEHRFVLQGYIRDGRWVLSPLGTYLNNDDVIAWKEIVLPKEIE